MAAQKGLAVLISIHDGTSTYNALGGIRTASISMNQETVDITSADNTDRWRRLLAGAGVKSLSVSGSGVFVDGDTDEDLRGHYFAGTQADLELTIPDFGTITGLFEITALNYAGESNGEATYDVSLESAGAMTWAAAV